MKQPQLITTKDGSHSLWVPALNETYHSTHGAIQESRHVFIQHGLVYWYKKNPSSSSIKVLEVGLGTGLNALLTYLEMLPASVQLAYTGLEPCPVPWEYVQRFNYAAQLAQEQDCPISYQALQAAFEQLHQGASTACCKLSMHFVLQKYQLPLAAFSALPNTFDIVYFDAFAPSKQPALWEAPLLQKVCRMMKDEGVMVTYCAQGRFKRQLKALGMDVETLPGPPGKKEMTRAQKGGHVWVRGDE